MTPESRARVLSIDVGVNGAFAAFGPQGDIVDMGELPRFQKTLSGVELASIFAMHQPQLAVLEKVASRPGQGVVSVFTFGYACGMIYGVACGAGVPVSFVTPSRWKTHFRLTGKPKDAARELAIRLYPRSSSMLALKKHCGRADALLMGRFALDVEAGRGFV
jgi:hypothetical protein